MFLLALPDRECRRWHSSSESAKSKAASRHGHGRFGTEPLWRDGAQFCAGASGRIRSRISEGRSEIWEKRTTVTMSSISTLRP
jgi:hypothetical protein